jgi:predicted dehydrogenase
MSESTEPTIATPSRRDLLKTVGGAAAASVLAGVAIPDVYAAEDNTLNIALIGCGGRGTGAVENALSSHVGPAKLVAMADVFPKNLQDSYQALVNKFSVKIDVPEERRFIGFDGYKKAMDCLKGSDVAIFTTPLAFRWVHFKYAIEKGLNVFMEKPLTADGPTSKRMLDLYEQSVKKNMKVGVGLMCRHCEARGELFKRIKDGQMGEILMLRAYRLAGPTASAFSVRNPGKVSDLLYQIQRFHSFLWASGGAFSDFLIHNIDECCWMKDAWPVEAKAVGGRHYRGDYIDQNFDNYSTEYTFADGTKLFMEGRTMTGAHQEFASYAHGSKAAAIISRSGHAPSRTRIFKNQRIADDNIAWKWRNTKYKGKGQGPDYEKSPYQMEWDDLWTAIRENKPYNEVKRGVEASLVTSMGRMAAHTGRVITYKQMLECPHEFAPNSDKLTLTSAAPIMPDKNGKYPIPEPGIKIDREY